MELSTHGTMRGPGEEEEEARHADDAGGGPLEDGAVVVAVAPVPVPGEPIAAPVIEEESSSAGRWEQIQVAVEVEVEVKAPPPPPEEETNKPCEPEGSDPAQAVGHGLLDSLDKQDDGDDGLVVDPRWIPPAPVVPPAPVEEAMVKGAAEPVVPSHEPLQTESAPTPPPVHTVVPPLANDAQPEVAVAVQAKAAVVKSVASEKLRETWHLMFGSRYEDEDDDHAHDQPTTTTTTTTTGPLSTHKTPPRRSSLRTKLDKERLLDFHLQTKTTPSVAVVAAASRDTGKVVSGSDSQSCSPKKKIQQKRPPQLQGEEATNPFLEDGLPPTKVRFCIENAMRATVACFAELHSIAQDEPAATTADPLAARGLFVTQWELDTILHELFPSSTTSCGSTSLGLYNADYASLPLATLLQVSWFVPFDNHTRLRSVLAQACRKHMNETKLAVVNTALQRHLSLRPFPGAKLQRLLLRLVHALLIETTPKDSKTTIRSQNQQDNDDDRNKPHETAASHSLVRELFHAIYIQTQAKPAPVSVTEFMRLTPLELTSHFQLTSVISIQRIVFFRFLIELLATETAKQKCSLQNTSWWPRTNHNNQTTPTMRRRSSGVSSSSTSTVASTPTTKRKKKQTPAKRPQRRASHEDPEVVDADHAGPPRSTVASQGSSEMPPEQQTELSTVTTTTTTTSLSSLTHLSASLSTALANLVRAKPWLVEEEEEEGTGSPPCAATRATFLAAEASYQSLILLEFSQVAPPVALVTKTQEFIHQIDHLIRLEDENSAVIPPPYSNVLVQNEIPAAALSGNRTPKPVQRAGSDRSFPPPYAATTPSYWTFDPEFPPQSPSTPTIPSSKRGSSSSSSNPQSVAKPTTNSSSSSSAAAASPGVGDYDLRRSDKLTFQQKMGFTFSKSRLEPPHESLSTPTKAAAAAPPRQQDLGPDDQPTASHHSSQSMIEPPPPVYHHWASAAKPTDSVDDQEEDDGDHDIDRQVRAAMRFQQNFVLGDMVQNLVNGRPTTTARTSARASVASYRDSGQRKPRPRPQSATTRRHHEENPQRPLGIGSAVSATATASVAAIARAAAHANNNPGKTPPSRIKTPRTRPTPPVEIKQPPRDHEPPADDAHLQWAARVSEFYKAKLHAATTTTAEAKATASTTALR